MQSEINNLAEFKDIETEKKFHDNEVKMRLNLSRNIVIIFAVVNFLFVYTDYTYIKNTTVSDIIYYSLIPRTITLVAAAFVFVYLKKSKNKSSAIKSVIVSPYLHIWYMNTLQFILLL